MQSISSKLGHLTMVQVNKLINPKIMVEIEADAIVIGI